MSSQTTFNSFLIPSINYIPSNSYRIVTFPFFTLIGLYIIFAVSAYHSGFQLNEKLFVSSFVKYFLLPSISEISDLPLMVPEILIVIALIDFCEGVLLSTIISFSFMSLTFVLC